MKPLEWVTRAIKDRVHKPLDFDPNCNDLKILQERLEKEEAFFSFGFDPDEDLLNIFEENGRIIKINPIWEYELGWTEEELTARPWREIIAEIMHPDDYVGIEDRVSGLRKADIHGSVRRMKRKSGGWVTVEWHAMRFGDGVTLAVGKIRRGEE